MKTGSEYGVGCYVDNAPVALVGNRFSLAETLKSGPVVLYFYPAAFTNGRTVEAYDLVEATPAFEALGASVIGVPATASTP